jgi:hypothetical protein
VSEPATEDRPAGVLSIDAPPPLAGRLDGVTAAAVTLPQLFQPAEAGREQGRLPDIRVIDGAAPSWPAALGQVLGTRARGVLLCAPTTAPAAEVEALARQADLAGCRVVVAMPFAYDPTVRHGLSRLPHRPGPLSFIDAVTTVCDSGTVPPRSLLAQALLAQSCAVAAITGTVPALSTNQATDQAYSVTGTSHGVTVLLTGLVSAALPAVLRVDLVGASHRHAITLAQSPAAPATFVSYDASGMSRPAPSYESGLRHAWRDLHAAVTTGTPVRFGLRELAAGLGSMPRW